MWSAWTDDEERLCTALILLSDVDFENVTVDAESSAVVAGVACRRGSLRVLQRCMRFCESVSGLNLNRIRVSANRTPLLSIAVMFSHDKLIELLLQNGCCVFACDEWSRTPYSFASSEFWLDNFENNGIALAAA